MPSAYVMINSEFGVIGKLVTDLKKIRGVQEVELVNGIYDIVTKISGTTEQDLERTNMEMRSIEGVLSTMTLIISRNYSITG
jgi:hypothetical protein